MKYIIPIIILSIFLIAGCEEQEATGLTIRQYPEEQIVEEIKEQEIICNSPYIRHADGCCLDEDSNNICDLDEEKKEVPPPPQPSSIIENTCSDVTFFECWGSYIAKDEIFLKLRARSKGGKGITILKKIEFPTINCEKEFEVIPKDQGLELGDIIEIKIPCKSSTTYYKDLPYKVYFVFYAESDTTEWLNIEKGIMINAGTLSGTVIDKPIETI